MLTPEEARTVIWDALHAYAEDSLGNRIGSGHTEANDDEYAEEWAEVCEAMALWEEAEDKGEGVNEKKSYSILPRDQVEKLVLNWVGKNKLYAEYVKDVEGIFQVNFLVNEETDDG